MSPVLKECPFCRNQPLLPGSLHGRGKTGFCIHCYGCEADGPHRATEQAAIQAWNRGTDDPTASPPSRRATTKEHAERCRELAARLVPVVRRTAHGHGYAICEHGSMSHDIDLVAVPWIPEARPPKVLAGHIQKALTQNNRGGAFNVDAEHAANPDYFLSGCPGAKPHGRLGWTWHLGGGPYIDLSVMPPLSQPYPEDE